MRKKVLSVLLCMVLVASLFTGCGKKNTSDTNAKDVTKAADNADKGNKTGAEKYPDFITVDVFDGLANYQGIQSGWFAKVVKDKFNMELNIIAPNVSGGGDTMYQTRSAAGELGDLAQETRSFDRGRSLDLWEAVALALDEDAMPGAG